MSKYPVVFESPARGDAFTIYRLLKQNNPVIIIEPVFAFHHNRQPAYKPPPFPPYINRLIEKGRVSLLKASRINGREIFAYSSDKGVKTVEAVYPYYRQDHEDFFQYVSDTLKSTEAEKLFKKILCERIAEFYSANYLLHQIEKVLDCRQVLVFPATNIQSYFYIKELLSRSGQDFFEHPCVRFSRRKRWADYLKGLKEYWLAVGMLFAQTILSELLGNSKRAVPRRKKAFIYGISIISAVRQTANNKRGPEFLVDNKKVMPKDVVYFVQRKINDKQKKVLLDKGLTLVYASKFRMHFSHLNQWRKLLKLVIKGKYLWSTREIAETWRTFIYYFRWSEILQGLTFRHYITHCDIDLWHIGRNLAFKQAGIQTWYFTDSMNNGCNLADEKNSMLFPGWTYLVYDHFVTWDEFLSEFFNKHPGSFKQTHIIGTVWSNHIQGKNQARKTTGNPLLKDLNDVYVLTIFDSTYGTIFSYQEGITFAEHILKLANEYPDCYIFFKEKKPRYSHVLLDYNLGPSLLRLYDEMSKHPGITILYNDADSSELISVSDMVISFPFTSTTFEALSINRPAIWHDPCGYYKDTPYGKTGGVTSHNYKELKTKVMEIKNLTAGTYKNPFPPGSPLMDPFRDGQALERFRNLLILN